MNLPSFLELTLFNAAAACLLAIVAALVGRWTRRPGLAHALWALVLLKLLVPPVIEMSVIPALPPVARAPVHVAAPAVANPDGFPGATSTASIAPTREHALAPRSLAPAIAVGVWAAGSAALALLTLLRVRRFRRLMRDCVPANPGLTRVGHGIAARMGVRCPALKLVAARVSPMLWCPGGSPSLLFPTALLPRLTPDETDALLAHELAHVRRRDHWLRFVELFATIAFWWHPVVWWARRALRRLEEQSCDALVLDTLPDHGVPYARGLVKTVEFLAGAPTTASAFASGATMNVDARNLEERLNMILSDDTPRLLSRTQRSLLAAVAVGALLVVPSWAEPQGESNPDAAEADDAYSQRMRDLDAQALDIEREMRQLDRRRGEMKLQRAELEAQRRIAAVQRKAEEAAARGQMDDARHLRDEAEHLERLTALKLEAARLKLEHEEQARELDLERQRELAEGDLVEAQRRLELELMERQKLDAEREYERAGELEREARIHADLVRLKSVLVEADRLLADGRTEEAEALREKARYLKRRIEETRELKELGDLEAGEVY